MRGRLPNLLAKEPRAPETAEDRPKPAATARRQRPGGTGAVQRR